MNVSVRTVQSMWVSTSFVLLLGFYAGSVVAQTNCSTEAPQGTYAVPPGTTVYYTVDSSAQSLPAGASGDSPQTQISNAFAAWNTANAGSGGDGTQFLPATATNPATVTITTNSSFTGPAAAQTTATASGIINSLDPATITLYPNANNSNFFQPNAPGYSTVYTQVMVHEIGHLMGFDDYPTGQAPPPGPGASAMNPMSGVNGTGQTPPTIAPTSCDITTAAKYASAITFTPLPVAPSSGGGEKKSSPVVPVSQPPSDGGGGGTGTPCTPSSETWDPATNSLVYDPGTCNDSD